MEFLQGVANAPCLSDDCLNNVRIFNTFFLFNDLPHFLAALTPACQMGKAGLIGKYFVKLI